MLGCLVLMLVTPLGCGGWLWWASQRGLTVEKLEQIIQAEVPLGSSREFVQAWFDRHGIRHHWSEDTATGMRGDKTFAQLAGLRSEDLSGTAWGKFEGPEVNVGLIFSGWITVHFFFDKQGRLVGHLVDPFIYAP